MTLLAAALVKVHAFVGIWNEFQEAAIDALKNGRMFLNASASYAAVVAERAVPANLHGIADLQTSHPTDSHPTLAVRLDAIKVGIEQVSTAALMVTPDEPAVTLVANFEQHEGEISEAYQLLLARRLGIEPPDQASEEANGIDPDNGRSGRPKVSRVRLCRSCSTRVLPTADGQCPRCGVAFG